MEWEDETPAKEIPPVGPNMNLGTGKDAMFSFSTSFHSGCSYIETDLFLSADELTVYILPHNGWSCSSPPAYRDVPVPRGSEGVGLIAVVLLCGNFYNFHHPPLNNSPLFQLYTCCGHPTNVGTSNAIAFGFVTSPGGSHSSVNFPDSV
ncbi:hypothetical protein EYF80_028061 [Liparis tanakae]|uniref:Uncharacterized protein n=1 Tax=Liparis tanakae TaxID=230148 RepID=A0A4Z2H7C1_9TELE|nr:hypothetical protein EYF80_028061 [Liparis tanakae]